MQTGTSFMEPGADVASVLGRPHPIRRDGAAKRILIVEDELLLAEDVAQLIHAMGLDPVGPVGTLEAAIALAETQQLDGALLDVRLRRGMRVYPVVEILWRRRIPFCFMTACTDLQIEHMPAEAVLRKPVSRPALLEAVQALLDG
ncbi:response regulator [Inquilinus sp. CA228]|uniref:response regulator n=1 Tax=Inquilinus sp. CA228 TaxID=3455609 RepID=UPI003F8D19ED